MAARTASCGLIAMDNLPGPTVNPVGAPRLHLIQLEAVKAGNSGLAGFGPVLHRHSLTQAQPAPDSVCRRVPISAPNKTPISNLRGITKTEQRGEGERGS